MTMSLGLLISISDIVGWIQSGGGAYVVITEWGWSHHDTCKLGRALREEILAADLGLRVVDTLTAEGFDCSWTN